MVFIGKTPIRMYYKPAKAWQSNLKQEPGYKQAQAGWSRKNGLRGIGIPKQRETIPGRKPGLGEKGG
jgi:hypothetical protein